MDIADKPSTRALLGAEGRAGALRTALILVGVVLAGLGLRLFRLDYAGYWHDEVISTFLARLPAAEIYRSVTVSDSHPPLYHILLHFWGALFSYELVPLRLLSVVTGLLCVPLTFVLARGLAGPTAGLLAAALMAASPFQILHGQQARMYPLLTLVVLLAILSLWGAWRRGGAWRWALFGLASAAGLYTHVYFAFTLVGLNLWACYESARLRRLDLRAWAGLIVAQLAAAALFLPFLPSMFGLTSGVVANFWIRENTAVDWVFALVAILNNGTAPLNRAPLWLLLVLYLPAASAIVLGLLYAAREAGRTSDAQPLWALLLFAVLTPCLVATALSLTVRPILLDRSLIGVSGPFFALLGGAAARAWRRPLTWAVAAPLAVGVVAGLALTYPAAPRPHSLQPSLDAALAERRPGEALVVLDWQSFDLVALRHPGAADVYVGTPPEGVANWQRRMALMRWHAPEQVGPVETFAGRYERVWVYGTPYTYPAAWEQTTGWLEEHGRELERREVGETFAVLYELAP